MSTGESPKTPAAGTSSPKDSGAGPAPKPDTAKAPVPQPEGGEDAEQEKKKPDPTRYGDWEKNGRCIDF